MVIKAMVAAKVIERNTNNYALAKNTGMSYRTLQRKLKNPDTFTASELTRLFKFLRFSRDEMIRFLEAV